MEEAFNLKYTETFNSLHIKYSVLAMKVDATTVCYCSIPLQRPQIQQYHLDSLEKVSTYSIEIR